MQNSHATVTVDKLADEIVKGLQEYSDLAADEMKKAVRKCGDTVRKTIKATAPVRTGAYAKSWRTKRVEETAATLKLVVHSPTHYRIAHLLENGHAKRGGGRVSARPHIAAAEEAGERQLLSDIERALR